MCRTFGARAEAGYGSINVLIAEGAAAIGDSLVIAHTGSLRMWPMGGRFSEPHVPS